MIVTCLAYHKWFMSLLMCGMERTYYRSQYGWYDVRLTPSVTSLAGTHLAMPRLANLCRSSTL